MATRSVTEWYVCNKADLYDCRKRLEATSPKDAFRKFECRYCKNAGLCTPTAEAKIKQQHLTGQDLLNDYNFRTGQRRYNTLRTKGGANPS